MNADARPAAELAKPTPPRASLDPAAVLGAAGGIGLILIAVVLGGTPLSFLSLPALLIVFGGTLAATTVCFTLSDVANTARMAAATFFSGNRNASESAVYVIRLAEAARRQGTLPLQRVLPEIRGDAILHKGLSCLIDGLPATDLEAIMSRDLKGLAERLDRAADVLRRAAEFAPAMGLIGTLIGLVQMLSQLDDPTTIGPAMAVALLTTLYGAILANLVLAPLAAKLEHNAVQDILIGEIQMVGVIAMSQEINPRRLELRFNSMLPPGQRITCFD